ncbi:hypothetical protein OSB04_021333 [Centaurea solstitialis]|uniref:indole-3-pyruvate monooxygenase n=1 Tax=Centaurea solstitialis TaxID=347529 RepID=A0AA38SU00_9ASTR|nr:hypothetical protein OSB04_021333 [Centaurea solstitialis]
MEEVEFKKLHDPYLLQSKMTNQDHTLPRGVWVPGPVIVGAGPSGLAAAACLKNHGVPSVILEQANCIASLWQFKTYDRLRLHLPKQFCQLPLMPFPLDFPTYPTKEQFLAYLESYAQNFDLKPVFNATVVTAEFDGRCGFWRVKTEVTEYVCRWLIVATGENAVEVVPRLEGMNEFNGPILHTSSYKSGEGFEHKSVLVVGCGNSGMEVCLDLCNYNAFPSLVVRDTVFACVATRDVWGINFWTVNVVAQMVPVQIVDQLLLFVSRFMLGDTSRIGLNRPKLGPTRAKTHFWENTRIGRRHACKDQNRRYKEIKRLECNLVEFVDGRKEKFDAIILATGYRSNVPTWLKDVNLFSENDGFPMKKFPEGWKGEHGLYAVGFTKRGLLGTSFDALKVAEDIAGQWNSREKPELLHGGKTNIDT